MLEYHCTLIMKNRGFTNAQRGLTRRQLLGLATLTGAGFAAGSIGSPEANAALEAGATSTVNTGSAKKKPSNLWRTLNMIWRRAKVGLGKGDSKGSNGTAVSSITEYSRRFDAIKTWRHQAAFANFPKREVYIVPGKVPSAPLEPGKRH